MGKFIDMTGRRYGRLTVQKLSTKTGSRGELMWISLCDCGKKIIKTGASIRHANTQSCGCLKNDHLRGVNNHQARKKIATLGEWVPCHDPWSQRAAGVWRRISQQKIKTDFKSVSELALYMKNIAPEKCPVFKTKLKRGVKHMHDQSPSLDKIIPSKGYVKGNLEIISWKANAMKRDATQKELDQFSIWHLTRRGYVITKQRNTVTS